MTRASRRPSRDRAQTWRSWSGLTTAHPQQVRTPSGTEDVAEAVLAARAAGLRVKMVGSGHSFSDVAATDGLLLRPDDLSGLRSVDHDAMTVTVLAGTPLHVLNGLLDRLGLALHNMGDIDRQTIAGAVATGTHGTGGRVASLSSQLAGLELVLADGSVVHAHAGGDERERTLFEAARVGLGALGIASAVTLRVEPAFVLEATEVPMGWADVVDGFDELADGNEHFEAYWFPHTDRMLTKRNNRVAGPAQPPGRLAAYVEDELLSNTAFGLLNRVGNRVPAAIAPINRVSVRTLSARTYSDVSHRVFTSRRRVRFREMEYAVPREAGPRVLREARALIERRGWRIGFPVEIRHTPADDVWLSPGHDRDSVYVAFHVNARTDHRGYFGEIERLLADHDGRPHWGKLHTRTGCSPTTISSGC